MIKAKNYYKNGKKETMCIYKKKEKLKILIWSTEPNNSSNKEDSNKKGGDLTKKNHKLVKVS